MDDTQSRADADENRIYALFAALQGLPIAWISAAYGLDGDETDRIEAMNVLFRVGQDRYSEN